MSQTQPTLIPFDRLPLGFRFRPTDEELINNYLKLKINGRIKPSDAAAVAEVDVCRLEPWDLPARSAIRSDDQEWFFFAPVDRKYPSGNRSNRATEAGYWKATGRDRFIRSRTRDGPGVVGMKKTLVFHRGRAPRGERTHWIMHEYRTVEREFEEGGFVLCRLFRKPEERVSGTITPEPEESGFSPILTKFYPINTLHIDDFVEGEYAAPLNEKSPESNMHEESQPLRGTINNQLIESKQDEERVTITPEPEESGFSPILTKFYPINTFHIDDFVEGEYAAPLNEKSPESNMHEESQPLRGTINNQLIESMQADKAYYLIPYPNKSEESHSNDNMATDERAQMAERKDPALYDELLGFLGPEYKDLFSDEFPGINVISADLEEDSVHDFLESILSVPANETGSTTMVASGSLRAVHEGSSSRDVDSGVLVEERGRDEVYFQSLQTSDRHNEIRRTMETVGTVKRKSRKLASPIESGTLPSHSTTTHAEDSLEKLSSSTDFIRHQGTAERRIKLESLKSREKKLRRRSQVTKLSDTRDPLGMVTDEVAKNSKNKTTEIEVPEPAFFVPYERSSDDGFSSDIQLALSLPEHEKPRSRSRPRHRRRSVCDSKMEGSSLHETKSRVWSIPTRRIGAAVLAIASLICAGAVWYFNS